MLFFAAAATKSRRPDQTADISCNPPARVGLISGLIRRDNGGYGTHVRE
jgi:hypothetical protein